MIVRTRTDLLRAGVLVALGAILVIALVTWLGGEEVFEKIKTLKMGYFLLALCLQIVYVLVWALRWSLIVRAQGQKVPSDIIPITFSGIFFNNITPVSKTGGEPVRGYVMGKANDTSFEEGMASVVVDRIFDMAPFILICFVTFLLLVTYRLAESTVLLVFILLGLATASVLSAIFILAALRKEAGFRIVMFFMDKLEPLIKRFRPIEDLKERAKEALGRFYHGIDSIAKNRRLLAICLVISLILWALVIIRMKVVFMSLGSDQALIIVNVVAVASIFAGFAPFLPGGLVATELIMMGFFIGLGVPEDVAGSVVVVDRLVSYWFMTLGGAVASIYLDLKFNLLGSLAEGIRGNH